MDYLSLLQDKGLGPPILAITSFFATFYLNPNYWLYTEHPVVFATGVATGAVLLLFTIAIILNDHILRLLAEEELSSAYIQIKMKQGPDKAFYTDYDNTTRTALDEMDEQTHKAVLAILTGALIAITIPAISVHKHGANSLIFAIPLASLPLLTISYPFYTRLHRAIDYAVRDTTSNHEN